MLETSSVDDDLANLKKELSGSSKVCHTLVILFVPWSLYTHESLKYRVHNLSHFKLLSKKADGVWQVWMVPINSYDTEN